MEQPVQNSGTARTRTVKSEEQIIKLLEEYETSGYSVKDFCEVSDVNEATFYSWLKKYRGKEEANGCRIDGAGFAAIELIAAKQAVQPQLFAEVGQIRVYKEVLQNF